MEDAHAKFADTMTFIKRSIKNIAADEREWMPHQIEIIICIYICVIRDVHRDQWDLLKVQIMEHYDVEWVRYGTAINVPRQWGKTEVVVRVMAQLLVDMHGRPGDPWTIVVPGLQQTTYQQFIYRVKSYIIKIKPDDIKMLVNNKSEITLTRGKYDERKIIGRSLNGNVSYFFRYRE